MVFPAEGFDAGATLKAIDEERCTAIYGVPTMFIAQLAHETYRDRNLSSLRTGIMAGSPCPVELMKRVTKEMGASEITIGYGQTEASPLITQTRTDDPLELRVGTVGRPIPGIDVKVVDPATGQELGDRQSGELCSRGHGVMLGYYNMPDKTGEAIDAEGWLHTGDLALREPNGYYRITGRIKDLIIRGGENIYPREIEERLYRKSWAYPTQNSAKRSWPGSSCARDTQQLRRKSASSVGKPWRTSKPRATSSSWTPSL
jgi:fatty-acyl-CoA synthase